MFASQDATPWYRSLTGLIAAAVLLPPVGLVLLWMQRNTLVRRKILGTLCIVLLCAGYVYLFTAWRRSSAYEAHYAALERHRAGQQVATANEAAPQGNASAVP